MPRLIDSVRIRLAFWHTVALACVLSAFSVGAYAYLVHTTRAQLDRSLAETASAFERAWTAEIAEGDASPAARAHGVREAVQAFRSREGQLFVYDAAGVLLAASDTVQLLPGLPPTAFAHGGAIARLVSATRDTPSYATFGNGDAEVRAHARSGGRDAARFTVVVQRLVHAETESGETFLQWLIAAVPIAILLSGIGGYLLARASLAPVVAMGAQARQISATSLDARLVIANPRDELGQLATVLNLLLARLQLSFEQQRAFMADASHELRTPIAVVRTAADVALDRPDREAAELRQSMEIIRGESRRLTRIVDDLFLLARADAGQQPVRREHIFLEEIVADVARAARVLAAARGVSIDAPPGDESPYLGDAALLARVLMNLVDNAIRHTPTGGLVRLSLQRETIAGSSPAAAAVRPAQHAYRIAVEDTGSGVPERTQNRLFERFVRGDSARGRAADSVTGGAGLGLAIARWVAEAHGGSVALERSSSAGSTFAVTLPISIATPS